MIHVDFFFICVCPTKNVAEDRRPGFSVSCRWVSCLQAERPWKQQSWPRGRQQLQDPVRRPPRAREPILEHLLTEMPVAQFDMEEHTFLENLRSARKGVAPGPSDLRTPATSVGGNPRGSLIGSIRGCNPRCVSGTFDSSAETRRGRARHCRW